MRTSWQLAVALDLFLSTHVASLRTTHISVYPCLYLLPPLVSLLGPTVELGVKHTLAILLLFASLLSSNKEFGSPNICADMSIPSEPYPPKICGGGWWFISCACGMG